MESSNIHHHQHQLQLQLQLHQDQMAGSSSLATTPSCYGVGSSSSTNWIPNSILNTHGFRSFPSEAVSNPRQQENTLVLSSQYSSIPAPDLGFNWGNTSTAGSFFNNQFKQDLQLSRIKEEQSNGNVMNKMEVFPGNLYSSNGTPNNGRGFSQILPSIHVSNLNPYTTLEMNLHALDLPTSSRVCGNFSPCSENRVEVSRDGFCYGGLDHMQHQTQHMSLYGSNKISASSNGFVERKRTSSNMEPTTTIQTVSKKSRLQARVSCPPFKVRKEKLGDRIAALQQLVAPFGKTDTASVLMEAIGYIKFLQNQVETLSVPYMKTLRNKTSTEKKWGSAESDSQELKRDLKSRGLCLVPLSCLSYITDGGGAVWPPPYFGGAT